MFMLVFLFLEKIPTPHGQVMQPPGTTQTNFFSLTVIFSQLYAQGDRIFAVRQGIGYNVHVTRTSLR
jgi:hypothetical protein